MTAQPRRVPVALGDRAYDILIGPDLVARAGEHCAPHIPKRRAIVVTDDAVARLHLQPLVAALKSCGIDAVGGGARRRGEQGFRRVRPADRPAARLNGRTATRS